MTRSIVAVSMLIVLLTQNPLEAQRGVSSSSMGVGRSGMHRYDSQGRYLMPKPEMFRVEEFVNYHRHAIVAPDPKEQKINLDIRRLKLENGKSVFQIGLATPTSLDVEKIPPLNLVLVIDESGSMSGDKISNLKQSLRTFVKRIRKNDRVTIVGFEHQARVILEACDKTNPEKIIRAIDNIHAGGSTNLHAGLMCGYEMALKHFDAERTNRLIFLTDGNANVGVTQSKEIAAESTRCIKKGISLVTIGLGVDFNHGLLREIADSGRGMMHYVGDAKDIKKIFHKDFESLMMPAARQVKLSLNFGAATSKAKIFGYENAIRRAEKQDDMIHMRLDDLNCGATQVVMVRVPETEKKSCRVQLSYVDAVTGKPAKLKKEFRQEKPTKDATESVRRNYAIALVANSLMKAAKFSNQSNNPKALSQLKKGADKAKDVWGREEDKHIKRVLKISKQYQDQLAERSTRKKFRK